MLALELFPSGLEGLGETTMETLLRSFAVTTGLEVKAKRGPGLWKKQFCVHSPLLGNTQGTLQ